MQLFLDTNVYLSFFKRSSDDLQKLEAIAEHVIDGGIDLFIPDNVEIEFYRNREKVVADELKHLASQKSNKVQLPRMADTNALATQIVEVSTSRNELIEQLSNELRQAAETSTLPADRVIRTLFDAGRRLSTTDEILARAKARVDLRNPPGKPGNIGDAINWECLLEACGAVELHIVSQDSDFQSPLRGSEVHEFLLREWSARYNHPLHLHRYIGDFLRQHLPDYVLNYDNLTEYWILQLQGSADVESAAIACEHIEGRDLSYEQSQRIIALAFGDVGLFLTDDRIKRFFDYMLYNHGDYERAEYHELAEALYDSI